MTKNGRSCPTCKEVLVVNHGDLDSDTTFWSGYLIKLGANFKTWRRRYFVLRDMHLQYFKSKDAVGKDKPCGMIHLNNAGFAPGKKEHSLDIATQYEGRTGRVFRVRAKSERELEDWIKALEAVLDVCGNKGEASFPLTKVNPQLLVKKGYMVKEGGARKSLRERYFVLYESHLRYYTNGEVFARGEGAIRVIHLTGASVREDPDKPNTFFVNTAARKFRFMCKTSGEAEAWTKAISREIKWVPIERVAPGRCHAVLFGVDGPVQGGKWHIWEAGVSIGRGPSNDIILRREDDPAVSRVHSQIVFDSHGLVVKNRSAGNFTVWNSPEGKRCKLRGSEYTVFSEGDQITVGHYARFGVCDVVVGELPEFESSESIVQSLLDEDGLFIGEGQQTKKIMGAVMAPPLYSQSPWTAGTGLAPMGLPVVGSIPSTMPFVMPALTGFSPPSFAPLPIVPSPSLQMADEDEIDSSSQSEADTPRQFQGNSEEVVEATEKEIESL